MHSRRTARGQNWGPQNALKGFSSSVTLSPPELQAFEAHIELLRELGATIIDDCCFEGFDEAVTSKSIWPVRYTDFKLDVASYLEKLTYNPNNIRTLQDVIRWTQADPREEYPARGTRAMEAAWNSFDNRECEEFKAALESVECLAHERGVRGALQKDNLDALILPTDVSSIIPALGGYPIITVPSGIYPEGTELRASPPQKLIIRAPNLP